MTASYVLLQLAEEIVRETVPAWLIPVFLAITRLGNVGVFMLLFVVDYWFGDHRRGAHAIAILIGGMALISALKNVFAVPRPPETVNVIPISGYSFPSGHAMGSAIAYGVLAHDLKVGSARLRYAVAGVLVALIALSRVVLGVHFVRDVLAGIVFGLTFLWIAIWVTGHAPRPGFAIALALAAVALVVSGLGRDSTVIFGVAVGAALVWETLGPIEGVDDLPSRIAMAAVGIPVLGGLAYLAIQFALPLVAVFGLSVLLAVGIIGAPEVVRSIDAI